VSFRMSQYYNYLGYLIKYLGNQNCTR
jgi:hypothetical protein